CFATFRTSMIRLFFFFIGCGYAAPCASVFICGFKNSNNSWNSWSEISSRFNVQGSKSEEIEAGNSPQSTGRQKKKAGESSKAICNRRGAEVAKI
ncbi:MAG: hypothetical protein C4520_19680, partial [Candidatus Abyssobacteria bacterium SURF_5]